MEKWNYIRELDGLGPKVKYYAFRTNADGILRAIRTGIYLHNHPTFTDLCVKIYTIRDNAPLRLVATSTNVWQPDELQTLAYRPVKTYFTFGDAQLKGATYYHACLEATGYTHSDASWVGLLLPFPNPENTGTSPLAIDLGRAPPSILPVIQKKLGLAPYGL